MSLSEPTASRQPLHRRTIEIVGYRRDDGLYDIEGRLLDRKDVDFTVGGRVKPPGEAIHDMWLRITVDRELRIVGAEARTEAIAYAGTCDAIAPDYGKLVGLGIVDLLPDAVKTALGIASPSKVFAELGRFSAMGYGVGFTAEAANMNAQVQGAIAMPDPGVVAGAASSSSTSSGNTFSGTIVIQSSGTAGQSTAEQAKELGDQVLDYLRRQWVAA